ncbi:GDP-mannose mannosyl hydrolase [Parvibium lacunae]|uniref:GDP-mannose mannosyl hydrolase n=1 Tax=Parvibium lacunae TaxID=1888893 RepID=UPI001EFC3FA8|nr:GDP-mannose mannosyl hydrolase [Parvibium lacunae]
MAPRLPAATWAAVVQHAPLVSIDLILEDTQGRILLGMRNNRPAQGYWFVPGGAIHKGETLDVAFGRIAEQELGLTLCRRDAEFIGVQEHHYADCFLGEQFGTHYVVLPYKICLSDTSGLTMDNQHREWVWMPVAELLAHPQVHENVKAYFVLV